MSNSLPPGPFSKWRSDRWTYLSYALGLVWPSNYGSVIEIDRTVPPTIAALQSLPEASVRVIIDEGRRFQDASAAELEGLRTKAQFAFTTCLVLLGVLTAELADVRRHGHWFWLTYAIAGALSLLALVGALAITANNVRVPIIHPGLATTYGSMIEPQLARDYALNAKDWINLNATLRSVLREAVLYLTLSAMVNGGIWLGLHH